MRSKIFKYLYILLLLMIASLIVAAIYFKLNFSLSNFESIIFSLKDGTKYADTTAVFIAILYCLPFIILLFIIFYLLFCKKRRGNNKIFNFLYVKRKYFTIVLLFVAIFLAFWCVRLHEYIYYSNIKSDFISDNYVDAKSVNVSFKKKRNLIYIIVESLETSLFEKKDGGYWDYAVIPELYDLLNDEDAVVFYDKNKSQTINMIQGSSWTTASIIANTSGLPLKVRFSNYKEGCMDGAYTLGDLLYDNNYHNELISAANTSFGDLNNYFSSHGNYEIIDVDSLDKYGFTFSNDDKGPWGFNDNYLFNIAKKRLDVLSKNNQPFNLELITIDTHFVDGYVGYYSIDTYKDQYENAYATESRLIYDFVSWLKAQPYYDNTTVVIMGDHLSMQSMFFRERNVEDRYVYSVILNPSNKSVNNSGRVVTSLDTFPTIVSAIGGEITGDRLGLGTNLFSNRVTIAEEYGIINLDRELKKKSILYDSKLKKSS